MKLPPLSDETWFLRRTCARPIGGRAHRPRRLEVESEAHRTALSGVIPGLEIEVVKRPVMIAKVMGILERGVVASSAPPGGGSEQRMLNGIMRTGMGLEDSRPWEHLDDEVIVVESVKHKIKRAGLVVVGRRGEPFGFKLFDSPEDARRPALRPVSYLMLELVEAKALRKAIVQEAFALVGARKRYACPTRVTRSGDLDTTSDVDSDRLEAVGDALVALVRAGVLGGAEPLRFDYQGVTLTLAKRGGQVIPIRPVVARMTTPPPVEERAEHVLMQRIIVWCQRDGDPMAEHIAALGACSTPAHHALLVWPTLEHTKVAGRLMIDWFRAQHILSADDQHVIAAHASSWNGYWDVDAIERDGVLALFDWVTGATERVTGQDLTIDTVVCGRVLRLARDGRVVSMFGGLHPRPLDARQAHEALRRARVELKWPVGRPVTVERASRATAQLTLARAWDTFEPRDR